MNLPLSSFEEEFRIMNFQPEWLDSLGYILNVQYSGLGDDLQDKNEE